MQYNTTSPLGQDVSGSLSAADRDTWTQLLQYLPASLDLEASARSTGALIRRREVRSAPDLLRLVLGYAVSDYPLRQLAMWFVLWGAGQLSKNGVRKRLRHCTGWLGQIIVAVLQARQLRLPNKPGVRLRLIDGTVISRPGSQGSDWRVHLSFDVGQACLAGVEVTDAHGAETLARFGVQPGEIRVADRGYAFASGLGPVLAAGGEIVVRTNWQNLPLAKESGGRFDVAAWLRTLADAAAPKQEQFVWLSTPQGRFVLRLIACPLPPEKAAAARHRAHRAARKKKHNVDERTLLAAGFVLLLTNLPLANWPAHEVLALYRLRWQVELLIKRLKSLLVFDGLRAQDPQLAQTYLLGKILGALLLEEMMGQVTTCAPAPWDTPTRPVSPWRLTTLCQEALKRLIGGPVSVAKILSALPRLTRFLAEDPRQRPSQWATAQALLHALSSC